MTSITGLGLYLPKNVRKNDWWSNQVTELWVKKLDKLLANTETRPEFPVTRGVQISIEALKKYRTDPFTDVRERRVISEDMECAEMESYAAEEAITAAHCNPSEIDLLLHYAMVPDYQTVNSGAAVHRRLKLSERCLVLGADAVCNSFLAQHRIADAMLQTGAAKCALLIQSSAISRIFKKEELYSGWVGDGATAVVLRATSPGEKHLLGFATRTISKNSRALITCGDNERPWYSGGHIAAIVGDSAAARSTVLQAADYAADCVREALSSANVSPNEIKFLGAHLANSDFGGAVKTLTGLENARFINTFSWTGSLSGANVPLQLYLAQKEGILQREDLVVCCSMGSGMTLSASVFRW